jgi:hypothetical protein
MRMLPGSEWIMIQWWTQVRTGSYAARFATLYGQFDGETEGNHFGCMMKYPYSSLMGTAPKLPLNSARPLSFNNHQINLS